MSISSDPPVPIGHGRRAWLGGSAMAAEVVARDWSGTPLGAIETWPQSLRSALGICLHSRFQMAIYWGPELTCLYNDAERAVLGDLHPGALGMPARSLLTDSWDVVGPQLRAVMRSGEATWAEDQPLVVDRNGGPEVGYFTYAYSPIPDDRSGVGGVLLVTHETTARVRAERRLEALRRLSAEALDASTPLQACRLATRALATQADLEFALVYLTAADGRRATCAAADGRSGEPQPLHPVVALDEPGVLRTVAESRAASAPLPADRLISPRSGGVMARGVAVVAPIRRGAAAAPAGFLVLGADRALAHDDGLRRFAEMVGEGIGRSLAAARAREVERERTRAMAALDRAKTALFSNASHELRTPLSLILGPLEQLVGDPTLPPPARDELAIVRRNAVRMLKLVNALLDFSRLTAGERAGALTPLDLAQATRDVAAMFASTADAAGLTLTVDCPPLAEPVYADRDGWEAIVSNLLSNALKFTPTGSIRVSLRAASGHAVLTVADTGIGIAPSEVRLVFSRFYRASNTRAPGHEGSGIGLALVRELVRVHGGSVDAASVLDGGTEVTVRIPLGSAHVTSGMRAADAPPATSGGAAALLVEEARGWLTSAAGDGDGAQDARPASGAARVLVVEDDGDMRGYLSRVLAPRYRVQAATDALAALAIVADDPPGAVIADVMMPGLDGYGLLRRLRAQPATRELPVMLLSARADPESTLRALDLGADDYVVKPFGERELLTRVRAVLERSESRSTQAEARGRASEHAVRERELQQLLRDLRAAQRRAAAAGDAERQRIERNLHDGAQQRLMAIRLELGLLGETLERDPSAAGAELDRLRGELDDALEELRELAHGLYPPLLASDGLAAAVSAVARRATIPVEVEVTAVPRLPRAVENAAYFCCLEALQNVAKHAGEGARATISLAVADATLRFRVTDDGAGFDREAVPRGHGLTNLGDRLQALGGGAEVSSRAGAGTIVTGWIPLIAPDDHPPD